MYFHNLLLSSTHIHQAALLFFFNGSRPPQDLHFSLHDALPISYREPFITPDDDPRWLYHDVLVSKIGRDTSELQSRLHLVCRLLLEKKKKDTLSLLISNYI